MLTGVSLTYLLRESHPEQSSGWLCSLVYSAGWTTGGLQISLRFTPPPPAVDAPVGSLPTKAINIAHCLKMFHGFPQKGNSLTPCRKFLQQRCNI